MQGKVNWLHLLLQRKKSPDKLPMWEGKSIPYVKPGILSALFPYEKVMHICKVEKSGSCGGLILQNSRSQDLKEGFLWSLPTQRCLYCVPWGLTACGAGLIDSMCRCLVWNKSGLTLYVPAIPVTCLMSLFLFTFISYIHHTVFTNFAYISEKEFPTPKSK